MRGAIVSGENVDGNTLLHYYKFILVKLQYKRQILTSGKVTKQNYE